MAAVVSNATRGAEAGRIATGLVHDLLDRRPVDDLAAPWAPAPAVPEELVGVLGRWWSEAEESVFHWRDGALRACLAAAPESSKTVFDPAGDDRYRAVAGRLTGEYLVVRRGPTGEVAELEWATYPFTRSPR